MRLFLDTNVLIDFLAKREPFYENARELMALSAAGILELWMSSSQVTDLVYILSNGGKTGQQDAARAAVKGLRRLVHVCAPGEQQVDDALESSWKDFEDAFVHEAARLVGASRIVTRDQTGYVQSRIPVVSPSEALTQVRAVQGHDG